MAEPTDLVDRLAHVAPGPSRDLDLGDVRAGARRRRRRRTAGLGVMAVTFVAVGALGAAALLADDGRNARQVTAGQPDVAVTESPSEPVGPERVVASGQLPEGGGRWTYVAFEAPSGICMELHSPLGGAGECLSPPPYETLSLGYTDARGTQHPTSARAVVTPEVALVRFVLASGAQVDVEPVDVGFPVNFVYTLLPDGVFVDRALALDADGQVLETGVGFFGVPDD